VAKKREVFKTFSTSYELLEALGEGGSGTVYRALADGNSPCALKVLDPEKATSEKRKRFRNEMGFCQRSVHKNIVKVLDQGIGVLRGKDAPFYVMPLYPKTLRTLIRAGIPPEQALPLFKQLLDGVEAAHLQRVYHRDLKPENVLFDPAEGALVIADFGVARFSEELLHTTVMTGPRAKLMNQAYAAPEQRTPGEAVDGRADIFALGLILNEMLTRSIPYGTGYARVSETFPALSYIDQVVERMIRQRPDDRPATISEVRQQLSVNEAIFAEGQKLSQLKSAVVPASEIEDPLLANPIKLTGVDYVKGTTFVFQLSAAPTDAWIEAFKSNQYRTVKGGRRPQEYVFAGPTASVQQDAGEATYLRDDFLEFLEEGNKAYARKVKEEEDNRREKERRRLKQEAKEAELRLQVLRDLSARH